MHYIFFIDFDLLIYTLSMEECETLCTRLAIMVGGQFRCLGSVQHLKSRFGGGYSLKVTVPGPNYDANIRQVTRYITFNFPLAVLKVYHMHMCNRSFTMLPKVIVYWMPGRVLTKKELG